MEILELFLNDLTDNKEPYSIGYQLQKAVDQYATKSDAYTDLQKLLLAYLTSGGVIEELSEDKVDWVAGGICLLERSDGKIFPRIAEVSNRCESILFLTQS